MNAFVCEQACPVHCHRPPRPAELPHWGIDAVALRLTPREQQLCALLCPPGTIVPMQDLLNWLYPGERLWGADLHNLRTIKYRLNRKLTAVGGQVEMVPGAGYRLRFG